MIILSTTLLFIYNANSNSWDKLFDGLHKVVSPKTYPCDLCKLTHGTFKEKDPWMHFKKQSAYKMVFMYKDQFLKLHGVDGNDFSFPMILKHSNDKYQPFVTTKELQDFEYTEALIQFLQKRLEAEIPLSVKVAS